VRAYPEGLTDAVVAEAVGAHWGLAAGSIEYLAIGGGSYHWRMAEHFVNVDDLDGKHWLGSSRDGVAAGLERAFDTAWALRAEAGLEFVVGPIPTADGRSVIRLDDRYTLAVFPRLDAEETSFFRQRSAAERDRVLRMLADLHRATRIVATRAPSHDADLTYRADLDAAIDDLGSLWDAGPLSAEAQALLQANAGTVVAGLRTFDRLRMEVAGRPLVVTHGEPHPGNVLLVGGMPKVIDWDTVGLAVPERDLWSIGGDLSVYAEASGHAVEPAAIELYRRRWPLDDVAIYVRHLRSPHVQNEDAMHALDALVGYFADEAAWM
jgi:spectinomycin phosphotransferase